MAYDGTKPVTGGSFIAADIRENFRALKEDGLITPADGTISQAKLKTSIGSVSVEVSNTNDTQNTAALPGGEYGFYPQVKNDADASVSLVGFSDVSLNTTYITPGLRFNNSNTSGSGFRTAYAQQRYVTSSGEVFWIFILRDKTTKQIISMYQAPDHPCFGYGGKPLLVPHPFSDYDETKHEIIVINPSDEEVSNMRKACIVKDETKPDRDLLEVISEDYEIDEDSQSPWPTKEVTVGLPNDVDWKRMPEGSRVIPIKKRIPQPSYITTRRLSRKR